VRKLRCSFCSKAEEQVTRLIAGAAAHICDECVALCLDVLTGRIAFERPEATAVSIYEPMLVQLPKGETIAVDTRRYWTAFVHGGEQLEWAAGTMGDGALVVGVRARGYQGAALGLVFAAHEEAREELARRVARERRGRAGGNRETDATADERRVRRPPGLHCSFCSSADEAVARLIAGPTTYICDDCIALCADIVSEGSSEGGRFHLQPSLLVHLPDGSAVAVDASAAWAPFVADGQDLEWIAGHHPIDDADGVLVVGVRKASGPGPALGMSFPPGSKASDDLAREVAKTRRVVAARGDA
jgi:hypothetical protein